ncbi:MAG TPA: prepilin-type N-terminal cleavage/methylation domain-containing protein [Acidimicrobiia bacterium]
MRTSADPYTRNVDGDPSGDDGFTLIELLVAISLLSIVAGGFVASLGLGFQTIALARQRQTASSIAEARLEHLRSIPYAQLALATGLTKAIDPTDPDYAVSSDGTQFDVDGHGSMEPLIVDAGGGVLHIEDVQVGTTVMKVYQYVTWVDDPGIAGTQDYRRVTVIVEYKTPTLNGISKVVRASAMFSSGTVSISGTTTTSPTSTTAPTTTVPSATTTTAPQNACPDDHAAPTGSATINGTSGAEAGFTAARNVTLSLAPVDACTPITTRIGNDDGSWSAWSTYDPVSPLFSWSITAGDGTKQVYVQGADGVGNTGPIATLSIILDTTKPTAPGTLSRTVVCSGTSRTVSLSWPISTDTNFRGYRVYRSTDGVTWSVFTQVSFTSASDATLKKSLDSVRYYVVAYDKAGNESNATNTIALSKNQCS